MQVTLSGLLRAGEDLWSVDAMLHPQAIDSGFIRIGDWDFPYKFGWHNGSMVCKIHRTRGMKWTEMTAESLEALISEGLWLL